MNMKWQRTCWQLSKPQVLHGACCYQGLLGIIQHMCERIHTDMEVGNVDSHSLFTHSRLVCVPGRLGRQRENQLLCIQSSLDTYTPVGSLSALKQDVSRGALTWLWSGKGIIDAHTPRIMDGWISQCVYVEQYATPFSCKSSGVIASITVSSSRVSMYSTTPLATRSCQLNNQKLT